MRENDTYEFEKNKESLLEKYEWDDIWVHDANEPQKERILFVGDSITRGMRKFANELLEKKGIVADQLATSKSVDNPYLLQLIDYVIAQNPTYKKINIMFGGHGFHLDKEKYAVNYEKVIKYIVEKYPQIKFTLASFTPLTNRDNLNEYSKNNEVILERREVAKTVSKKYNLSFTDVYSVIAKRDDKSEIYYIDGVHFKDEGYKIIAKTLVGALLD